MNGDFKDGKNEFAKWASIAVLLLSFIVSACIIVKLNMPVLHFVTAPVTVGLTLLVSERLAKGRFSADEKSVVFQVGFQKYEYSYKNIINVRTKTVFTNGRYGKILHIEIALSFRNGSIVRFCDTVSQYEYDTMEDLKELQEEHQFTELADYIKSKL